MVEHKKKQFMLRKYLLLLNAEIGMFYERWPGSEIGVRSLHRLNGKATPFPTKTIMLYYDQEILLKFTKVEV